MPKIRNDRDGAQRCGRNDASRLSRQRPRLPAWVLQFIYALSKKSQEGRYESQSGHRRSNDGKHRRKAQLTEKRHSRSVEAKQCY